MCFAQSSKCNNTIITIFLKLYYNKGKSKAKLLLESSAPLFLHNPREKTDYGIIKKDGRVELPTSENFLYFFFAVSHLPPLRLLLSFINKESLWPSLRKQVLAV